MRQTMMALFVLLLLSPVIPPGYCNVTPGASAFIGEPEVNFDTVAEGGSVYHTFIVENRGDAPLHILRVNSG